MKTEVQVQESSFRRRYHLRCCWLYCSSWAHLLYQYNCLPSLFVSKKKGLSKLSGLPTEWNGYFQVFENAHSGLSTKLISKNGTVQL
jgi:hypothetical protein